MGARPLVLALLSAALARGPAPTDGWEFLARGKPSFARTAFTNQLKRAPDDARAHVGLGLAELALGNADVACTTLLEAIKKTPDDRDARLGLARAFLLRARHCLATGHDDDEMRFLLLDAESQGERAAELQAADPEAWIVVVEVCFEQGKFDRAEAAIGEAEKRGLDAARKRRLRGELSYFVVASGAQDGNEEKFAGARDTLTALLREDPGATDIRLRLGDLCHAYGRWNDVLDAWQAALVVEPFDRPTLELLL